MSERPQWGRYVCTYVAIAVDPTAASTDGENPLESDGVEPKTHGEIEPFGRSDGDGSADIIVANLGCQSKRRPTTLE